jgi:hypothetical protein
MTYGYDFFALVKDCYIIKKSQALESLMFLSLNKPSVSIIKAKEDLVYV